MFFEQIDSDISSEVQISVGFHGRLILRKLVDNSNNRGSK